MWEDKHRIVYAHTIQCTRRSLKHLSNAPLPDLNQDLCCHTYCHVIHMAKYHGALPGSNVHSTFSCKERLRNHYWGWGVGWFSGMGGNPDLVETWKGVAPRFGQDIGVIYLNVQIP